MCCLEGSYCAEQAHPTMVIVQNCRQLCGHRGRDGAGSNSRCCISTIACCAGADFGIACFDFLKLRLHPAFTLLGLQGLIGRTIVARLHELSFWLESDEKVLLSGNFDAANLTDQGGAINDFESCPAHAAMCLHLRSADTFFWSPWSCQ